MEKESKQNGDQEGDERRGEVVDEVIVVRLNIETELPDSHGLLLREGGDGPLLASTEDQHDGRRRRVCVTAAAAAATASAVLVVFLLLIFLFLSYTTGVVVIVFA